ncbi:TonB-dependent receptor [Rhodoferax sp. 4810]|nr:TonB-dependent receptor [Rhodoferax jenense]
MRKTSNAHRRPSATLLLALFGASSAMAAEPVFELGTITVVGTRPELGEVGEAQVSSVVTQKELQQFNRTNVGDALGLLSGVTLTNNVRNEKMIAVRGFDVRQVPLFIDGIPVYVPYDGYVDFNRFTTADLAAIQVNKGFSSVSYGPNALGGAINLISRKPKERFEGDASVGFASGSEKKAQVNVGTNQGLWYLQAGASYTQSDNFPLSSSFTPTATEDGGARNNSYRKDSKLSLKLGLTPNASDEYTLSYYKQNGEKGQPPSTVPTARYWKWPFWDKESFYFISKTALGDKESLKVRLYWDKFDNGLDIYANATYPTITNPAANQSTYDDSTTGGSVELTTTRLPGQEIKFATHYKKDEHIARDGIAAVTESFQDTLSSVAVEDNIAIGSAFQLSLGLARHNLKPQEVFKVGAPFTLPNAKTATNGQAGLFYDFSDSARFYATLAQKTRLPTLKDRYSSRFNTFNENTGLRQEEAVNYEVGYQGSPWADAKAEAAIYYSNITDKIQTVYQPGQTSCTAAFKCQMQNVGKVRASGIELGLSSRVASWFELGGNYTLTRLSNISDPTTKLTDIPRHKLTAHALFHPNDVVDLIAFAEYNSSRWVSNTQEISGFTTLNLKAAYRATKSVTAEIGVNNVTDKNYALANGFPSPGRMVFANASYQF